MELILIIIAVVIICLWLWISVLSLICLVLDPDLESIQRWGQGIVVVLIPFAGASLILKLVNDHSPEVIEKFYIPWPFYNLVIDKKLRSNGPGSNGEESPGVHSGGSGSGGD